MKQNDDADVGDVDDDHYWKRVQVLKEYTARREENWTKKKIS